ncbi:iron ABC transporter permease [Pedobacter sp. ISL-68]|uniref:FecCD family ABC transporter permease n=1 Tax=unclassified Pedobacter TaxID=2628915 RepID=UPI001BE61F00|nr:MULTISPECIES: iron ABC transporter permease [unclassified Pedobacter]MBT2560147.1 iron ABC transporter permease [Pedobacter sp. ISL-64]MBT2589126.1 iron ABC transporter permease [Pedobacter sp. ISL-68]
MRTKKTIIFISLLTALLVSVSFSFGLGAMQIPVKEVLVILGKKTGLFANIQTDPVNEGVMFMIRLPRILLGILVGAALGISGAAIQGIFRNPLAEPGLMGISAGASLMAVAIIALEGTLFAGLSNLLGYYLLAFGAFVGAGVASLLVYSLSKTEGRPNVATMLLAGIAINALAGALTGLVTYLADEQQLRTITFWMLGSLGGATWENVLCLLPFVLIPVCLLPLFSKGLNLFAIGESQAELIGLNPGRIKACVVLLATMAVGASVAVSGIIGFVGLLVPHTIRLLAGADHRFVLPASALFGALVLTLADMLSRILAQPIELPIGVITALLGTPLFLYILIRDKKKILN